MEAAIPSAPSHPLQLLLTRIRKCASVDHQYLERLRVESSRLTTASSSEGNTNHKTGPISLENPPGGTTTFCKI